MRRPRLFVAMTRARDELWGGWVAPIASLLAGGSKQGIAHSYVRGLRAAFGKTEHDATVKPGLIEPGANASSTCFGCSEPTWAARTSLVSSWRH